MPVLVRPIRVAVVPLFLAVAACYGDGTGVTNGAVCTPGGTGAATPTLSSDVQPIFTASCAFSGCHGGSSPQQGMNLTAGQAHANIANVPSRESRLVRVCPGQPDSSYLVHKIQGTQATVGGSGDRMPLGGAPLSDAQIKTIRDWITAGAQNN